LRRFKNSWTTIRWRIVKNPAYCWEISLFRFCIRFIFDFYFNYLRENCKDYSSLGLALL